MTSDRLLKALAWSALGLSVLLLQGLPGHRVPFFTGDLAYHLATVRTVHPGSLGIDGPYQGLPGYYGGAFPLLLVAAAWAGADPAVTLMVVSWAEPLLWLVGAAILGRSLWPDQAAARFAFAGLVLLGAGTGLPADARWVDAPNLAGQAFWPLFPRDVALVLVLLSVAAAVRKTWWLGGMCSGIAICFQAQVGAFALASTVLVVLVLHRGPRGWVKAVAAAALAIVVASWWWVPRVFWTVRYGLNLSDSDTRVDLAPTLPDLWHAYGLLLPLALVAVIGWLVANRRSPTTTFLQLWLGAVVVMVVAAAFLPGPFISLRRALVLAFLPLAAATIDGIVGWTQARGLRGLRAQAPAVLVAGAVVAVSVPTLRATHEDVASHWLNGSYGSVAYPDAAWAPVWTALAKGKTPVLEPPGDSAMGWFRSGRPVLYASRPGYLKLGFDPGRATGWSEDDRRSAVVGAFMHGPGALCDLATRRNAGALLLRTDDQQLGVVDVSGGAAATSGLLSKGGTVVDRNTDVVAVVPPVGVVDLGKVALRGIDRLSVWQALGDSHHRFELLLGHRVLRPRGSQHDGASERLDFRVPAEPSPQLRLTNRSGRPLWLVRLVGYTADITLPGTASSPAALVGTRTFCRAAP
ncbi:MAG: hypothetical protein QOK15_2374 [Nocardioidaceae bacterium]|nr:hypothetical protein [Nocardioidaceae bacterium]